MQGLLSNLPYLSLWFIDLHRIWACWGSPQRKENICSLTTLNPGCWHGSIWTCSCEVPSARHDWIPDTLMKVHQAQKSGLGFRKHHCHQNCWSLALFHPNPWIGLLPPPGSCSPSSCRHSPEARPHTPVVPRVKAKNMLMLLFWWSVSSTGITSS